MYLTLCLFNGPAKTHTNNSAWHMQNWCRCGPTNKLTYKENIYINRRCGTYLRLMQINRLN